MNNLSSYCGLVDAKKRASNKDLPVQVIKFGTKHFEKECVPQTARLTSRLFVFENCQLNLDSLRPERWHGGCGEASTA